MIRSQLKSIWQCRSIRLTMLIWGPLKAKKTVLEHLPFPEIWDATLQLFHFSFVFTFLTHWVGWTFLLRQNEDGVAALQHSLAHNKLVQTGFNLVFTTGYQPKTKLINQLVTQTLQVSYTPLNMMDVAGHFVLFFLFYVTFQIATKFFVLQIPTKTAQWKLD